MRWTVFCALVATAAAAEDASPGGTFYPGIGKYYVVGRGGAGSGLQAGLGFSLDLRLDSDSGWLGSTGVMVATLRNFTSCCLVAARLDARLGYLFARVPTQPF